MRGVDEFLLCKAWRTDLESESMMNLEDLWFTIMFIARSIAMTSAGFIWEISYEFSTPVLASELSLKFEQQQVSLGFQDSCQYSGRL